MRVFLISVFLMLSCGYSDAQVIYKKIAQRHDDYTNNTWTGIDSFQFFYNNEAVQTGLLAIKCSAPNTWDNWFRYTYTFNAMGKVAVQLREDWISGNWTNSNRYTYTYDTDSNNTEILYDVWNGGNWNPTGKITYTGYNTYGKYGNEYVYGYNAGNWVNQTWRLKNYVNNQYLVSDDERYIWHTPTLSWKKYERLYHTYFQDEISSITRSVPDTNNQWMAKDKYLYNYLPAPVLLSEYIVQKADSITFAWQNISRVTYNYTPTFQIDKTQNETYSNNTWVPTARSQSIYNASDLRIEYYTETNSGTWQKDQRSTYAYTNNLVNEELQFDGIGNNWVQTKKIQFSYNAQDSLIFRQEEQYSAGNYLPLSRDFYYYNSSPLDITENGVRPFEVSLYPNPATEQLNLEIRCRQNLNLQITIKNISGSTLLIRTQKTNATYPVIDLPLTSLSNGFYLLQILDMQSGKKFVEKFEIQR